MQAYVLVEKDIPHALDWLRADTIQAQVLDLEDEASCQQATALLIRTEQIVNHQLLARFPKVRFIGSATAGIDHVDLSLLQNNPIAFAYAPGCNAPAVANYVAHCVDSTHTQKSYNRVGIIGFGHVGQRVASFFESQEYQCVIVDPFVSTHTEQQSTLHDLQSLDYLCIHPNLHSHPKYGTYALVNEDLLSQQADNTVIIQASRGSVGDEKALLHHANRLKLCLDVWHNEPLLNPALLQQSFIATPHIAGYSYQSKWRASHQVLKKLYQHFSIPWKNKHQSKPNNLTTLNLEHTTSTLKNDPKSFVSLRRGAILHNEANKNT